MRWTFLKILVLILLSGCNKTPVLLLSGDSITNNLGTENIGRCEVINIAKGGAGVNDAIDRMEKFTGNNSSATIVAIGVNDAKRKIVSEDFYIDWERQYLKLINLSKNKSERVYMSTILPIEEKIEPYGSYADPLIIKRLNDIIRKLAYEQDVTLIEANLFFSKASQYTLDGVHLNPAGSARLRKLWNSEVKDCTQ